MVAVTLEQPTGSVFVAYLTMHRTRLLEQDALLRSGEQESVHQMRVAARRMRSALATYRPVLVGDTPAALTDELRWLGGVLAPARDAQVLQERLDGILREEPAALVRGPVSRRIDAELGEWTHDGQAAAQVALGGDRYARLLADLGVLVDSPPFAESADRPARKLLPRLLRSDLARVHQRHRVWERTDDQALKEHHLHQVRKAAKRLRYAAESAAPVLGEPAERLAGRAEALQELLGDHQDTVVARSVLLDIAAHAQEAGEDTFTFGRLHALEEARATAIVAAYLAVLAGLPVGRLRGSNFASSD